MKNQQINKDLMLIDEVQKEIYLLNRTFALLHWDTQTYMPKNAIESRTEQLTYIRSLIHDKITSEKLFMAVNRLRKVNLVEREAVLIKKLHKDVDKSRKLPKEFIKELSKTTSLSFNAWKRARDENDFEIFRPYLEKVVELKRKESEYLNFKGHPLNALIDSFEEGMTVEKLKPILDELKIELIKLLNEIKSSETYKNQNNEIKIENFSKQEQLSFAKEIAVKIIPEESSRLDLSEHPFSTKIGINDVRITTNIRDNPLFSISSTIHEAGHALYELNLPKEEGYTKLGEAPSYGLHESQSRFWELMIGSSLPFWEYYYPRLKEKFNLSGDINQWYKKINLVKPSPIRIESDEVHYCLHIILRFELESQLLEKSIEVKDLKEIWNNKMKEYFGIEITNDKEGILQDVHWSEGYFGYFPSYALGTIYSSQIYNKLKEDIPDIEESIRTGNLEIISNWLDKNIHKIGAKKIADDLINDLTGKRLDINSFINYLKKKYAKLYNLSNSQ